MAHFPHLGQNTNCPVSRFSRHPQLAHTTLAIISLTMITPSIKMVRVVGLEPTRLAGRFGRPHSYYIRFRLPTNSVYLFRHTRLIAGYASGSDSAHSLRSGVFLRFPGCAVLICPALALIIQKHNKRVNSDRRTQRACWLRWSLSLVFII